MKNTGMVVTLDIGSTLTIHPPEKILIGKRLAIGLYKDYGFDGLPHSGPVFKSLTIGKQSIREFDYAERGVTSWAEKNCLDLR